MIISCFKESLTFNGDAVGCRVGVMGYSGGLTEERLVIGIQCGVE